MRRSALLAACLIALLPCVSHAQSNPSYYFYLSPSRYLDAGFATMGSQLIGVPMPPVRGQSGDWRLTVAPAYVQVHASPLEFQGGSLNLAYSRRLKKGWGLHGVVLGNRVTTLSRHEQGSEDAATGLEYGFDGELPFSESFPSGSAISTLGAFLGATYTARRDVTGRAPVTLFAGPIFAVSSAPNLRSNSTTTGIYGTTNTYRSDLATKNRIDTSAYGVAFGVVTEYRLGPHFLLVPHIYQTILFNTHWSRKTVQHITETCNGASCGDTVVADSIGVDLGRSWLIMPGLDVAYRNWGLSFNLVEPFGGRIARTSLKKALHGAWPVTFRISRQFGTFEK